MKVKKIIGIISAVVIASVIGLSTPVLAADGTTSITYVHDPRNKGEIP